MNAPPLELSPRLRDACRRPRLAGDAGTVLMLDAGYFIQRECREAFRRLGWQTVMLPLQPHETFVERFFNVVLTAPPDLMFTVNHLGFDTGGALTGLLEAVELPCVSWFVDSPAYILLDHRANASPLVVTPVWERDYIPFLREFGFGTVFHLPLATDLEVFRGEPLDAPRFGAGFVGDSMTAAVTKWLAQSPPLPGRERLVAEAAGLLYKGGCQPPQALTEAATATGVGLAGLDLRGRLSLQSAAVLQATLQRRRRMVEALRDADLHLFGDEGWLEYKPDGVTLHPPVDYYRELAGIYRNSVVNLNTTSAQMPSGVNQRVFDVPAAGGFLLTDRRGDLELLFAPGEVALYDQPEELPERVAFYKRNRGVREKTVRRAAERIRREHTYERRLAQVIARVRREFAPSRMVAAS